MKFHQECAHCNKEFGSSLFVRELIIQNSSTPESNSKSTSASGFKKINGSIVRVSKVFAQLFKLDYLHQLPKLSSSPDDDGSESDDEEISICGQCASLLTSMYKLHQEWHGVGHENSYLAKKIQQLDTFFHEIQQTWSHMLDVDGHEEENSNSEFYDSRPPSLKMEIPEHLIDLDDNNSDSLEKHDKSEVNLKIPRSSSSKLKSFYCAIKNCGMTFSQQSDLKIHIQTCHPVEPPSLPHLSLVDPLQQNKSKFGDYSPSKTDPICPICDKLFANTIDLANHVYAVHTQKGILKCPICHQQTATKTIFVSHIKSHFQTDKIRPKRLTFRSHDPSIWSLGEKFGQKPRKGAPYICPICSKEFSANQALKVHQRLHTGERPFKCPHCDYAGTQLINLKRHVEGRHKKMKEIPAKKKIKLTTFHMDQQHLETCHVMEDEEEIVEKIDDADHPCGDNSFILS